MASTSERCTVIGCRSGPCWRVMRATFAAAHEIPLGCVNRAVDGTPLPGPADFSLTPEAAELISSLRARGRSAGLAGLVRRGRLVLLEPRASHVIRGTTVTRGEAPDEPELAPPPTEAEKSWIRIRVVDDRTGEPVRGVKLHVKLPNGSEQDYMTRTDGLVEVNEIDPGACDVSSDFKSARLDDTLDFVVMGEAPSESDDDQSGDASGRLGGRPAHVPAAGRCVAEIEAHKVQTGETIESLARGAGLTWQELSEFNWGTSVPERINEHLRDDVGCTKKTADGHNYVFTSEDEPGIVYIPRKWSQSGLATEQMHTVRVRKIVPPAHMTISYILASRSQASAEFPKYVLESVDGSYYQQRSPRDDLVPGDEYLQLRFENLVPGTKYNLRCFYTPAYSELVFAEAPFDRIVDQGRPEPDGLETGAYTGLSDETEGQAMAWGPAPEEGDDEAAA